MNQGRLSKQGRMYFSQTICSSLVILWFFFLFLFLQSASCVSAGGGGGGGPFSSPQADLPNDERIFLYRFFRHFGDVRSQLSSECVAVMSLFWEGRNSEEWASKSKFLGFWVNFVCL